MTNRDDNPDHQLPESSTSSSLQLGCTHPKNVKCEWNTGTFTGGIGSTIRTGIHRSYTKTIPRVLTRVLQYTCTIDIAQPRHQHHTPISHSLLPLVIPLIALTFQALSNCSVLNSRGFHVGGDDVQAWGGCVDVWTGVITLRAGAGLSRGVDRFPS